MPLRSGKEYLVSHKCVCGKFYSNRQFEYKCSECFGLLVKDNYLGPEEFTAKCDEWAKNNVILDQVVRNMVTKCAMLRRDELLLDMLSMVKLSCSKLISSEFGVALYRCYPSLRRGHIVASFVADWWNINSNTTDWPAHLSCYYGNFNEPLRMWNGKTKIPPRMPNSMI